MITALFIFDAKGDVVMSKLYKAGVKRNIADVFRIQILSSGGGAGRAAANEAKSPVLTLGLTSFVYIRSDRLWICAVTRSNQDCGAIMEFLYGLELLLRAAVPGSSAGLTSEAITGHFSAVFDLLEEVVEFGYPVTLDLSGLKVASSGDSLFKRGVGRVVAGGTRGGSASHAALRPGSPSADRRSLHDAAELAISWRQPGIKYRRNEIFLNVEEKVHVLMLLQAEVLRAYVDGAVQMKTHLSGMPVCRFGINEDSVVSGDGRAAPTAAGDASGVTLEDSKFHQCVELDRLDLDHTIQFVPPDGEFELMSYQCRANVHLPFTVHVLVLAHGPQRLGYKVTVGSLFAAKLCARDTVVRIPTPVGVVKHLALALQGRLRFSLEDNALFWRFGKFFGHQQHIATAEVEVSSEQSMRAWTRPPVKMDFTIDMFLSSGLTVRYLKVSERTLYRTVKWVKYATQLGSYEVRF